MDQAVADEDIQQAAAVANRPAVAARGFARRRYRQAADGGGRGVPNRWKGIVDRAIVDRGDEHGTRSGGREDIEAIRLTPDDAEDDDGYFAGGVPVPEAIAGVGHPRRIVDRDHRSG